MSMLEVNNLRVSFETKSGLLKAVRGISFSIEEDETLAIVGESGSGKSVTAKTILNLLSEDALIEEGSIVYNGRDLLSLNEREMDKIRGKEISIVFQDTSNTINPLMKISKQFDAVIKSRYKNEHKNARELLSTVHKIDPSFKEVSLENVSSLLMKDKGNALIKLNEFSDFLDELKQEFLSLTFTPKEVYKKIANIDKALSFESIVAESLLSESKGFFASFSAKLKLLEKRLSNKQSEKKKEFLSEVYLNPRDAFENLRDTLSSFILSFDKKLADFGKLEPDATTLTNDIENAKETLKKKLKKEEIKAETISLLEECGIENPERVYESYPFELSGGMRQRISIALALSYHPKLLICDEATTALDATVQEEILLLLEKLKKTYHCSILFITHDLSVVARIADKIVLMYGGKILERGTVYDIFYDPRSPYAWGLLSSSFINDNNLKGIKGNPPSPYLPPKGDPFASRNEYALEEDFVSMPNEYKISNTHYVASYLYEPKARSVRPPKSLIDHISAALKENPGNIPTYENKKNSIIEIIKKKGGLHE